MGVVGLAVGGDGVGGDLHHGGDDVHAGTPLKLEALPHGGSIGAGLALDFELLRSWLPLSVSLCLFGRVVAARARLDELRIDLFVLEARAFG